MPLLYPHQCQALEHLKVGSILRGGIGSGKSITALAFYFCKICEGNLDPYLPMTSPRPLYIITTARKRDSKEWEEECAKFILDYENVVIDSWNNIHKYTSVIGAFFIFDEQRVVGNGKWVRSFLSICKKNKWILLTATPGDTWTDYIPVFIANGFYKNRTEFMRRHVVFSRFSKYPKIERYVEVNRLSKLKEFITVNMDFERSTKTHFENVIVEFDKDKMRRVYKDRWNIFTEEPIQESSELFFAMRRIVNQDKSRLEEVKKLIKKHNRVIIFYNFNYELDLLRGICIEIGVPYSEWNGQKHQDILKREESWVYLVQYFAGGEGWNCIDTNVIIFYSLSWSYKMMVQAAGRIDRLNTPFTDLYYYILRSRSFIDVSIYNCLTNKEDFNEREFIKKLEV